MQSSMMDMNLISKDADDALSVELFYPISDFNSCKR